MDSLLEKFNSIDARLKKLFIQSLTFVCSIKDVKLFTRASKNI